MKGAGGEASRVASVISRFSPRCGALQDVGFCTVFGCAGMTGVTCGEREGVVCIVVWGGERLDCGVWEEMKGLVCVVVWGAITGCLRREGETAGGSSARTSLNQ
jgi:hypothetical protein